MTTNGDWHGLYREGWKGEIVDDAFAHPAKYARGLIRKIYSYAFEQGYLRPGDTVLDPFGGVALGALDAMKHGCNWIGCELEEKFVKLGNENLDRWEVHYRRSFPEWGRAWLVQGDSRQLCRVVEEAGIVVTSPPYAESFRGQADIQDRETREKKAGKKLGGGQINHARDYGTNPANLGNLPPGDVQVVVSSPPYAESIAKDAGGRHDETYKNTWGGGDIPPRCYSDNPANLGNLAGMDAVVSSPPMADSLAGRGQDELTKSKGLGQDYDERLQYEKRGFLMGKEAYKRHAESCNLGSFREPTDTFWAAARTIVDQCHAILKPGGYAIWVVKRFVRNKEIVDFPGQWEAMCQAAGFETTERIRAWLVEEKGTQLDLFGNGHELKTERKSFFRRLYEKKYPENSIDWEDVIEMRKP